MINKLYVFVFFLLSVSAFSQTTKVGVKGGLNLSNFTGSESDSNFITSYHAGVFAEFSVLDIVGFQPEVLYSSQGAEVNVTKEIVNLSYLSVPLLFKLYLFEKFSLEAGPQFSYLVKDDFNYTKINKFDASAVGGLGFKVTENLFLQGRYIFGITEIPEGIAIKNQLFQASVGYSF